MILDPRLEERYIVVKLKDITEEQESRLRRHLKIDDIPTRCCIVVEPDWKCYEQTVQAVLAESEEQKDAL